MSSEQKTTDEPQARRRRLDQLVRHIPSPLFGDPVSPWHFWFAWRPVFTWDRRFVWLHRIHRRLIQKHQYLSTGGNDQWWQYHFESGYMPNPSHQPHRTSCGVGLDDVVGIPNQEQP